MFDFPLSGGEFWNVSMILCNTSSEYVDRVDVYVFAGSWKGLGSS